MKRIALLAAVAGLGSCGRVADLQPPPGHALPVKPAMARATPTVKDLLTPPTYARPDRVDELIRRSQPRAADPFDLPPATGGEAPPQPAGAQPQPVTTDTKVTTPGA
ncbi:MAG TPA: hypothetical protein VE221_03070 [Sphingomicrobium sp.]|jgi:hypothetical protein|nr:hypothetical protein [Sphingomicrobium sp.]